MFWLPKPPYILGTAMILQSSSHDPSKLSHKLSPSIPQPNFAHEIAMFDCEVALIGI